ncbi:transcription-repair coupling factor [Mediannikoviicoccus vaginalis]|uniref:transcription-repair coupling factor n=1 Tax=Mediannikoviicoccus vaginalis TaxID=2899727 RepID=UPI001F014E34|nr:transcription-repair coupling factor [Mediannikoviicoccus vaginalis]
MNFFTDTLKNLTEYQKLSESLKLEKNSIYLHGIVKENLYHLVYSIYKNEGKNILIVTEDETAAKKLVDDLEVVDSSIVEHFPEIELNFYNFSSLEKKNEDQRLKVLNRLMEGRPFITVASSRAIQRKITKKNRYKNMTLEIEVEKTLDLDELSEKLIELNYERVSIIEGRGQFAIRGGIVDIYPIQEEYPVRIELFDDEIDSMRTFNISDQRSVEKIDRVKVVPARELILDSKIRQKIIKGLCRDLDIAERSTMYGVDKDKLIEKYGDILEYIENGYEISNPDLVVPYLKKVDYNNIVDYLPKDSVIIVDDISRVYDRNSEINQIFKEDIAYRMEKGEVFITHEDIFIEFKEIIKSIMDNTVLNVTPLLKKTRLLDPKEEILIESSEAMSFNRNMDVLQDHIHSHTTRGEKFVIFAGSQDRAISILNLCQDKKLNATIVEDFDSKLLTGMIYILPSNMPRGFEYKRLKFTCLTTREIYGKEKRGSKKTAKKRTSSEIINYSDLEAGDFVVHENHGIGQYQGIEQINVQDTKKDYLVITYRGNDKLYIPTDQMNLVQKYVGTGSDKGPRLNKLGGAEWQKAKLKAKKSVETIAQELVELYAKRSKLEGFAFDKDGNWQREFEEDFIYEETPSQLRSIAEIKKDMESKRPMDRLLCGDVGYGKTEVAIRAAFKAVMNEKQVAILVPTTILAQQHYNTFIQRIGDYPVEVEMLSRFRTPGQQKKIIKDVERGLVDIIIGTHRLLSKDMVYKDLGLLIVDEEQRFGVKDKEKLKALKENVDVLTLSATPIPRTLQMGLVGIRDMSTLDEPPEERFPINTYVIEYNEGIIRDAILKEMDRAGQVYFVYNKVQDIEEMSYKLQELVPDARIAIAHGQMSERELENVMLDFEDAKYDILLCTTIIETGMDIPNVNTMIVYNADRMGLSQLYQLKGRIGRSDRTSFAYFTYEKNKSISQVAEKRLMAIKDFTEFGSGYKIAMRDLELRGAGNILGEVQSGHISAIGYDLYVKLLEETLGEIRGENKNKVRMSEVEVDIKMDAYIPSSYISDASEKIEMYKKIASIIDENDYDELIEELIDRFGDLPKPVQNIMDIALTKSYSAKAGFIRVFEKEGSFGLEYSDKKELNLDELKYISENFEDSMNFDLGENPKIFVNSKDLKPVIRLLVLILNFDNINKKKEGN